MALIGDTSELDTLLYGGKYMLPEASSYTMTTPWGVVSSDVSGGFVRQQLQFFNSPAQVQVVYKCVTKTRVDFLKSFIRLHEGLPFIAALAVDTDEVEPYVVDVVGAPTWQENGFSGTCTLTYQVQPTPNADYDEFLQWSGTALGDDLSEFANWIAKTANYDFPKVKQLPVYTPGSTASFINNLYYNNENSVSFSDAVDFSRLSGATYIDKDGALKTAAINEQRFEKEGLLIEGASTNLHPNSVSGSSGSFTGGGTQGTISTVEVSVAGTTQNFRQWDATEATNSPSNAGYNNVETAVTANTTVTLSWVVKWVTPIPDSFSMYVNSPTVDSTHRVFFDSNWNVISKGSVISNVSVKYIGDEFYRVGLVVSGITPNRLCITITKGDIVLFGMPQYEALPFATSYIPTSGAAATRATDSVAVDMQPHGAGTILAEFVSDSVAVERIVYIAGAVTVKILATGAISVASGAITVTSAIAPAGNVKSAVSYDGSTLKLAVNGVVYSASSALPAVGTSIVLGESTFANVWQRSEAYDNARLIEVTQ